MLERPPTEGAALTKSAKRYLALMRRMPLCQGMTSTAEGREALNYHRALVREYGYKAVRAAIEEAKQP